MLYNNHATKTVHIIMFQKDSQRYARILNDALKDGLISTKHITAVGFSLGAQISGHVCRLLDDKCGHILGCYL